MPALAMTTKSVTRKEILDLVLAYFLLTNDEQTLLIAAIYTALRDSMIAAYNWNCYLIGITIEYIPTKKQEKLLNALAKQRGNGIAATYETDITTATTRILDAFEKANGTLDGVLPELRQTLKEYTDARTEQKAQDISGYETGEGANTGTQKLIDDIVNSDEGDTVYVSEEDMALLMVGVLPEFGQCDVCSEYGGEMWPLLEADSIGVSFPVHLRCVHALVFIDMRDEAA